MSDRKAWRGKVLVAAVRGRTFVRRLDPICARMNAGLTVVALALGVVVLATAAVRAPVLLAGHADIHAAHQSID